MSSLLVQGSVTDDGAPNRVIYNNEATFNQDLCITIFSTGWSLNPLPMILMLYPYESLRYQDGGKSRLATYASSPQSGDRTVDSDQSSVHSDYENQVGASAQCLN